jgi:type VI secretion system protein ImpA
MGYPPTNDFRTLRGAGGTPRVRFTAVCGPLPAAFLTSPSLMFDVASFASALDGASPSGPDLEYDPVFLTLEQAGAGKPEQQFGERIFAAEGPDWRLVHEQALDLARRSRDLRVAVWLARSEARLHGLAGALQGLMLVHRLLENLWPTVHPQLDAAENDDPTMRMNALAPLISGEAFLADLRAAWLLPGRGAARRQGRRHGTGIQAFAAAAPTAE